MKEIPYSYILTWKSEDGVISYTYEKIRWNMYSKKKQDIKD